MEKVGTTQKFEVILKVVQDQTSGQLYAVDLLVSTPKGSEECSLFEGTELDLVAAYVSTKPFLVKYLELTFSELCPQIYQLLFSNLLTILHEHERKILLGRGTYTELLNLIKVTSTFTFH